VSKKKTTKKKVAKAAVKTRVPGAPKARKRTRDAQKGMTAPTLAPPDDRTLMRAGGRLPHGGTVPEVQLLRPSWKDGHMIVRPLPTWNPMKPGEELDPIRKSAEPNGFRDWIREVTAVSYWGSDDDAVTFLLYDKENSTPDEWRVNPAVVLFRAVNAIANPQKPTSQSKYIAKWAKLIVGSKRLISPPTSLLFMGGLVFKRGNDVYFGKDALRVPVGLADDDAPPIIQLKGSPRFKGSLVYRVKEALNALNPEWEGDLSDWENSMLHGDVVAPEHGRFLTIYNPKAEGFLAKSDGDDDDDDGEFGVGGQGDGSRGKKDDAEDIQGYQVRVDRHLHRNGKLLKKTATLEDSSKGPFLTTAKRQIVFLDDILYFPSVEEQCLLIARALRHYRELVELGWQRHPEFLTDEVRAVLADATQAAVGGDVPEDEEGDDEALDESLTPGSRERRRSAGVPAAEVEEAEAEEGDDEYETVEEIDAEGEDEAEVAEGEEGDELEEDEEYEVVEVEEEVEVAEGEEGDDEEGEEAEAEDEEVEAEAEEGDDEYEFEEVEVDEEDEAAEEGEDASDEYEDPSDVDDEEYEEVSEEEPEAEAEEPDPDEENFQELAEQAEARSAARKAPAAKKKGAPKKKKAASKATSEAAPKKKVVKKKVVKKAPPSRKKKKSS